MELNDKKWTISLRSDSLCQQCTDVVSGIVVIDF